MIRTDMTQAMMQDQTALSSSLALNPGGIVAEPDDVAGAAVFSDFANRIQYQWADSRDRWRLHAGLSICWCVTELLMRLERIYKALLVIGYVFVGHSAVVPPTIRIP